MKFFLVLLVQLIIVQAASAALYGYCLSSSDSLSSAINYLNTVIAPSDKAFKRSSLNCIEVEGSPSRFSLYDRFLRKRFNVLKTYKDGENISSSNTQSGPSGMCRIKVTKKSKKNLKKDTYQIGRRGKLKTSEIVGSSQSVSSLVLSYKKQGYISVGTESLGVSCYKSGSGYQLSFSLDSANSSLSSSAHVMPRTKLNLGGVVNDLNNKRKAVSINEGLKLEKDKGLEKFDYFLEVE